MITASNISLSYGTQVLFKDVNIKFTPGNCYGIIGANGAGKSTFMKILSGEIEADSGEVIITPGERMAVLRQDHFAFNKYGVLETVIMGYDKLYSVMKERDEIYAKEDFSEEDGLRAAELETEFAEMGGWEAESEAAQMLDGLGIPTDLHDRKMEEIEDNLKVRVLLAQALFGNPDILLLDEPTNHLDLESVHWLEDFLADFNNTVIVVSHDRHFLNTVCTHICDPACRQAAEGREEEEGGQDRRAQGVHPALQLQRRKGQAGNKPQEAHREAHARRYQALQQEIPLCGLQAGA